MKLNAALHPIQAPHTAPLPESRSNLPRVLLRPANPATVTADLNQAISETLVIHNVEIVVVLPAVLEKTGYHHGGIND